MSQIHFSPEKRAIIDAHRRLDEARDAMIDADAALDCALRSASGDRILQATETRSQANAHYDAACLQLADANIQYRLFWESAHVKLSLAAEAAKLTHLAS